MFDRNDVEEYQSVAAPDRLKERVMNTYDKGKVTNISLYKSLMVVAASLVLVISASTFAGLKVGNISIMMNGKALSASPEQVADNAVAMVAAFRETPSEQTTVSMQINSFLKTVITVTGGEINVFDAETGEMLYSGNEYEAKGKVLIDWCVDTADAEHFEMNVKNALKNETLSLDYVGTGSWTIYKK